MFSNRRIIIDKWCSESSAVWIRMSCTGTGNSVGSITSDKKFQKQNKVIKRFLATKRNKVILGDKRSLLLEVKDVTRSFVFETEVLFSQWGSGDQCVTFLPEVMVQTE